ASEAGGRGRTVSSGSDPDRTRQAIAREFSGGPAMKSISRIVIVFACAFSTAGATAGALDECMIRGDQTVVTKCLFEADSEANAALIKAEGAAGARARQLDTATGRPGAAAALAKSM